MKRASVIITFLFCLYSTMLGAGPSAARPNNFTWGAEVGTGIDMGGDNMSTLNLRATAAYTGPYLELAGIGAGIDMVMSNSCRAFPVYAIVRSSFAREPRLFFCEMRGGVAFNQATGIPDRTNLFLQPGVGIHLATGNTFSSYLTLSYTYNAMTFYGDRKDTLVHGINLATIAIGVVF